MSVEPEDVGSDCPDGQRKEECEEKGEGESPFVSTEGLAATIF